MTTTSKDLSARSPAFHDRREFGRRATFKRALMRTTDGLQEPAIVVDISEGGARLTMRDADAVPDAFDLLILDDDFAVWCEVMHRSASAIGVRFVRAPRKLSWMRRDQKMLGGLKRGDSDPDGEPA